MPKIPEGARVPDDHKSKRDEPLCFSFIGPDGSEHVLAPTETVLTPKFVRLHRRDMGDMLYTLIEELADEEALEAFDGLSFEAQGKVLKNFDRHSGVVMGTDLGK